jgi:hypothetical protein
MASSGTVYYQTGTSHAFEATLDANGSHCPGQAWITPGPDALTVFIGFVDGRIFLYDYDKKQVRGFTRRIPACIAVFYSRSLGVFIGLHSEDGAQVIRIWGSEVAPASLSSVTSPDPADLAAGHVASVRVQLRGDQGEPCEGLPVAWSDSEDLLITEQSVTDEDGYAVAKVRIPPVAYPGATTVTAEVVTA